MVSAWLGNPTRALAVVLCLLTLDSVGRLPFALRSTLEEATAESDRPANRRLVLIVDGYSDAVIYDRDKHGGRGTNIDELSPALSGIDNVVVMAELVHPDWHRHDEIIKLDPDLVVVHLSAFRGGQRANDRSEELLVEFLGALGASDAKVLVYSRSPSISSNAALRVRLWRAMGRAGSAEQSLGFVEVSNWTRSGFPAGAMHALLVESRRLLSLIHGSDS